MRRGWRARVPLAVLLVLGLAAQGPTTPLDPFTAFGLVRLDGGVRAPEFTLPDLSGRPQGIRWASPVPTLLVFWATW